MTNSPGGKLTLWIK